MQLMKRTTISLALGAILTLSACSEYDFDSKYEDPSKVTTVSISNLMVGVFQRVKDYDLYEYDEKVRQGEPVEILKEANRRIAEMVKEESDKALAQILKNASEHMKIRYHRGDN